MLRGVQSLLLAVIVTPLGLWPKAFSKVSWVPADSKVAHLATMFRA
jgi:hypothetical protein